MKTRTTLLAASALLAGALSAAQAFTYESPTELFLNADLDGDGIEDVVIVDRPTGAFRLGYQLSTGTFSWADARPSGITNVSAASSGRMLHLAQDALAFSSVDANRVNVFSANSPTASSQPIAVFPKGLDLAVLVSLNAGIAPVTPFDDLVCATTNGIVGPNHVSLFASTGSDFAFAVDNTAFGAWKYGARIQLKGGGKNYVGATVAAGNGDGFRVFGFDSGNGTLIAGADGLPSGSRFVSGRFSGGAYFRFVFFVPGGSNLVTCAAKETSPGVFGFDSFVTFPLDDAIDQLYSLNATTSSSLLAVLSGGQEARIYSFDGAAQPVMQQSFQPAAGQSFSGVVPFGVGSFQLLSAAQNSGRSSQFQQYAYNGSSFVQTASGNLPSINPLGINANVFLFNKEPFVAGDPGLIQTLNAADWSSSPSFGGGFIKVSAEQFDGATSGLDNPASRTLGIVPAGANFALVNQYAPGISVASFQPALGAEFTKVNILPTPGPQAKAVQVSFTTSAAAYSPLFSFNGGPWTPFTQPIWIYKTTSIRYFAQKNPDGILKTPTHAAVYSFATDPSKADSDGDGFTDLSELLAHTDPNSQASKPSDTQHAGEFASFDLKIAPRPFDATSDSEVSPQNDVDVHLHDLNGSLLQTALTQPAIGGTYDVDAVFINVLADRFPTLLAVGTALNFEIATASTNTQQGRELLGLVSVPAVQKPVVNYTLGNQSPTVEANQWVAAAVSAYASAQHPVVAAPIGVDETLAALLLERKINQVLFSRGVEGFNATNLTLFGFRRGDSDRLAPTIGQLVALSLQPDAAHPAYDLETLHATLLTAVTNDAANAPLRQLAFDVYRTSGLSNNASPGLYPLPVDAIRGFLLSGVLNPAYVAASALSDGERQDAFAAAASLLASLSSRPIATFNLDVTASSFDAPIPKLMQAVSGDYLNLFTASGVGYKFPDSFSLIPGSRLEVTAYTDFIDPNVAGASLQVISASLISAPPALVVDNNHNLISDAWEGLFLAGSTDDTTDTDGDGFTDLQEFLDGTDPKDPLVHSALAVHIGPPALSIKVLGLATQGPKLGFVFPSGYAGKFKFTLESAPDLNALFQSVPIAPVMTGVDQLEIQVPIPNSGMSFYRLRMELP
jgi:hypothetical protein